MCGIVGIHYLDAQRPVREQQLRQMASVIKYRGPDDEGYFITPGVGFGFRRLSIIDLSTGHQPMSTEDEAHWVVFNGEIYNYLEIRKALGQKGHRFRTQSDTEVILQAYRAYGQDCVEHFNGMFAFAIWDAHKRELFLARDRIGIKPLYYWLDHEKLLFASEIKSLLQYPDVVAEATVEGIDRFMTFGYATGPDTIFRNVHRLMPGHTLTVKDREVTTRRYWQLSYTVDSQTSQEEHETQLKSRLEDAIRLRLRSDVPLGVFLSGGLDSSAVVGLLASMVQEPLKTFSIGFEHGKQYNELNYARLVSERFGTEHHEYVLKPAEFQATIPDFIWHMDEPVTEAAAISLYHISRVARENVTVVLSGEGADELFAGYTIYAYMHLLERYRSLPSAMRTGLNAVLRRLGSKWAKYADLSEIPLEERYLGTHLYDIRMKSLLYTDSFSADIPVGTALETVAQIYSQTGQWHPLNRMLALDMQTWLPDNLLIKADRMSMANSLELRVPFLDHTVVEYAATLPTRLKVRPPVKKYILKRILKDTLPSAILRRRKMGFPTPLKVMFRTDMGDYVKSVLTEQRTRHRGIFQPSQVSRVLHEHESGAMDHHKVLWQMLVLEEWFRVFVDGPQVPLGDSRPNEPNLDKPERRNT